MSSNITGVSIRQFRSSLLHVKSVDIKSFILISWIELGSSNFTENCPKYRIGSFLWIWSQLLKKSLMENLIFYAVKELLCFNSENLHYPEKD